MSEHLRDQWRRAAARHEVTTGDYAGIAFDYDRTYRGKRNGQTYYLTRDSNSVTARTSEGRQAGYLTVVISTNEIGAVNVHRDHQRQGLATAMLQMAREDHPGLGHTTVPGQLSPQGEAWARVVGVSKTAMPPTSWRPVVETNHVAQSDCVILTQYVGRRRFFEVYTYGVAFGNYPTLDGAKAAIEEIYGGVFWERVNIPKVEVVHYFFGPTDEFSDPTVMYVASLPRLGSKTAAYDETQIIRRGLSWWVPEGPAGYALAQRLAAGTATAEEVVRALEPLGIWWGIAEQYGGMAEYESHAEQNWDPVTDMLRDTEGPEDWFGATCAVVFTAKRPVMNGKPWDPDDHNPRGNLWEGNSYLEKGQPLEVIEVRYDAGNGYRTLPCNVRTRA